jgi:signal transduction histidine kinase
MFFVCHLEALLEKRTPDGTRSQVSWSSKRFSITASGVIGRELACILQEALNNTRQPSGAQHLWVLLRADRDRIQAEVDDEEGRGSNWGRL